MRFKNILGDDIFDSLDSDVKNQLEKCDEEIEELKNTNISLMNKLEQQKNISLSENDNKSEIISIGSKLGKVKAEFIKNNSFEKFIK